MAQFELTGQLVDVHARRIRAVALTITDGRIAALREVASAPERFFLPGFVDAHVHVESSMLPPAEFARMAVTHGTVASVSDPHEIANVLGVAGVEFMLENARHVPFKFCFGASPCVPATTFETAGAALGLTEVTALLRRPDIGYLSEVMNWPGVLAGDATLAGMIAAAKALGKPVDGHAPGLRGEAAARYAAAGIETDHECFTLEEALDKIAVGMRIAIREGSAARNFAALEPLLRSHPGRCFFCTDDLHPNALVRGHVDRLVARAVAGGADLFDVLRVASVNPVEHYRLPVGLLRVGDAADFVVVEDLEEFRVLETWIDGACVARDGTSQLAPVPIAHPPNRFVAAPVSTADFALAADGEVNVIVAEDGQLITGHAVDRADGPDVAKIAVVNRYAPAPPAVGFIRGFGLRVGAIASSVAHDSHNVVVVGCSDEALAEAANAVIARRGGVAATDGVRTLALPLEIAGLMSTAPGEQVAADYERIADFARSELGSTLRDPFMTLSFMALLVIPDLKMSDRGLFSGKDFRFVDVRRKASNQ